MEKVKLPKKVADAIGEVREHYKSGCEYDLDLLKSEDWYGVNAIIEFTKESRDNTILYFQALVNGYEVEETPEDRVRAWYELFNQSENKTVFNALEVQGIIEKTLNILNIKIEGVNA